MSANSSVGSIIKKADVKSDARNASDAKTGAEPSSTEKHAPEKTQQKKHREELESPDGANKWTILDLNKAGKHGESVASGQTLTQNPTHEKHTDADLQRLVEVWPSLNDRQRKAVLAIVDSSCNATEVKR